MPSFPLTRKRRNRYTHSIRNLVRENNLTANDLIWPVFVLEGNQRKEEIKSMPGVFRMSQDLLLKRLDELHDLGLNAVALFPVVTEDRKSINAEEAFNEDGLVQRTIRAIKMLLPDLLVISDVALDPYLHMDKMALLMKKVMYSMMKPLLY